AHTPARSNVCRLHLVTKQPGTPFTGRQQTRQHLHCGRLTAAVRAKKTKDLAATDAETDMIDSNEIPETHGQILRLDRDAVLIILSERRDADYPMTSLLLFR